MRFLFCPILYILLFCPSAHSAVSLNFGLYASDKPTVIVKKFRPVLNHLEDILQIKLGTPVHIKIQVASSYKKGIDDLASGKVDFARFGPASYIEVKQQNEKVQIIAIESKNGSKRFKGIICVHEDSQIQSVDDLKGTRFAFGNELSTIGRYLSQQYLVKHAIKATDLDSYEYLGRHDKVGHAVGIKQYDAGALKESTFYKLTQQGVPIRVLAEFENVTKPWLASSTLDTKIFKTIQESLVEINQQELLTPLKVDEFVMGSDDDYSIVRTAIQENSLFFSSP